MVQAWGFGAQDAYFRRDPVSQIRGLIIEILFLLQSQTKCRLFPLEIKAPCMRANRRAVLFFSCLMKPKCWVCRSASEWARECVKSKCRLEERGRGKSCQFGNRSLMEIRSTPRSYVTYRNECLMELIWVGHSSFVCLFIRSYIHQTSVWSCTSFARLRLLSDDRSAARKVLHPGRSVWETLQTGFILATLGFVRIAWLE